MNQNKSSITQSDIAFLSQYFTTQTELKQLVQFLFKSFATPEDIQMIQDNYSHLPDKNDFYTRMDQVMGELQSIREEQTLISQHLHDLREDIDTLRQDFEAFKKETKDNFKQLRSDFNAFKKETRANFKTVHAEITELRQDLEVFKQETKNNFKDIRSEINEIRQNLDDFKQETQANFKKLEAKIIDSPPTNNH